MEKVRKPLNPAGGKRQRKISQSAAVIEPKKKKTGTETKNKSETIVKKNLLPDQSHSDTSKVSTAESVPVNTQSHVTQTLKKKKLKTPKNSLQSGLINTIPIKNDVDVKKSKKRQADTLQANPSLSEASSLKKKKKRKQQQMLTELNELKEQIIGPTKLDLTNVNSEIPVEKPKKVKLKTVENKIGTLNEEKYAVLKDQELIDKFMGIPLTNNQKGRIREAIKLQLQGSEKTMFPDIINGKIQAILKETPELTGHHLRRIRVLYNMLKTSLTKPNELSESKEKKNKKQDKKKEGKGEGKDAGKKKGPKRYVVFLGNLPLDINKEKIMDHFRELNEHIKDIRFPPPKEGKKSAIAYVELSNEPSYELALSKHHSMLGSRRIKVLYTTQKGSKITRAEAKGKSAKLIALQRAGKLVGSVPTKKKRSHRRAIMKQAKKSEEEKLAVLA